MTEVGQVSLAATAKIQLRILSDALVPKFYIDELRYHLRLCPTEDKFHVKLEPNVGYGSVTCLKDGCNKTIPLTKHYRQNDGGKRVGFGSLSAYRTHLSEHKALAMVKRGIDTNTVLPKEVIKPRSKVAVTDVASTFLPPTSVISGTAQVKSAQASTRKRPSDAAFTTDIHDSSAPAAENSQVSKKPKPNVATKTPLSSVTNKNIPTSKEEMFGIPQDPFSMLDNVLVAMAGQQNIIQTLRASPFKSVEDWQSIQYAENELRRLDALEQSHRTAVQGMSSSAFSNPFLESGGGSLSHPFHPMFSFTGNFAPSAPSTPQPFPMDLDPPFVRSSNPEFTPAPFSAGPSLVDSFVPIPTRDVSTDYNIWKADNSTPLPAFSNQNINEDFIAAQASSSKELPAAPKAVSTSLPHKMAQTYKPQASSSKALPDLHQGGGSEDDSDSDYSSDEENVDTTALLNRIGVTAPLPILNDAVDDNGDYYGRGRDLFDGPKAAHDDLEKFLIQAGNAEVFDGNERVEDALKYLGLKSLNNIIPGMEVPLMAHQAMGVKWMLEKEHSYFKGGCLADEMGLGKTIQTIATIVKNRSTESACKTTLIVAPLALLDQWQTEIETRTNCGLTCLIYHGSTKTTSKKKFLQHDIVLTTFSTLAREWPDFESDMKKKKKAKKNGESFIVSDDEEDMKNFSYRSQKRKERAGLLFQVEFFRVVLDEAHYIRNRRTRTSRALTDIQSTYRWCLTGTPIVNTLEDAYSYLRFLKIRPWYDWDEFNTQIARNQKKRPELAITRLHAIMGTFLLRRQKNTKMDGEPIIKLPNKDIKLVKLEFSQEEREVYKMAETHNQAIFNRYLRAGTVLKNYHHVLVLLLRLRQICSHATLLAEDGNAYVQSHEADEDFIIEFANELTRARRLVSEEFVTKMKEKFKREALARMEAERASTNATIDEEDCPICFDAMTDAVLTGCGHIFCRECIVNYMNTRPAAEAGDAAADRGCPCCRELLDAKKLFSRSAFEPSDRELNPKSGSHTDIEIASDDDYIPSNRKGKGKASERTDNRRKLIAESENDDSDDDMSDFIVDSDEDEEEKDARRAMKKRLGKKRVCVILDSDEEVDTPEEKEVLLGVREKGVSEEVMNELRFLPSSKMKYMMDELERLFKTKPDEKTLVVSQWTTCLDFVSKYLTEQEIPHVKYQGNMDRRKRDQAVRVFMSKEKARVMLMSLKCGGVGLNLTRANNVISLDLGWSFAVESQAFDRVHRVGQMRNVLVQRVVIADTVEDRILHMQERKKTFADGALGEGSGKKMGKLSVKELANLFGLDARGRVLKD